ncbi:MAG: PIG-L family deacetylase [Candidatus Heimdallarchaeota archaeon]|nr:PIG-L family deacetylase [Candidatus Heimdallarchaeota archaeon]
MFDNILVLSPHTDDGELGCGGTIHKFHKKGSHIRFIAFSWCDNEHLKEEVHESTAILGVDQLDILNFSRRYFYLKRQEILDYLYKITVSEDVDLVLTNSTRDLHQDHQVICNEAVRAFKTASIWGFEMPWNNIIFQTNCFVNLSKENMQQKIKALNCYKTQRGRSYFSEEFQWGVARTRGLQVKTEYAEAFEVIKIVVKE